MKNFLYVAVLAIFFSINLGCDNGGLTAVDQEQELVLNDPSLTGPARVAIGQWALNKYPGLTEEDAGKSSDYSFVTLHQTEECNIGATCFSFAVHSYGTIWGDGMYEVRKDGRTTIEEGRNPDGYFSKALRRVEVYSTSKDSRMNFNVPDPVSGFVAFQFYFENFDSRQIVVLPKINMDWVMVTGEGLMSSGETQWSDTFVEVNFTLKSSFSARLWIPHSFVRNFDLGYEQTAVVSSWAYSAVEPIGKLEEYVTSDDRPRDGVMALSESLQYAEVSIRIYNGSIPERYEYEVFCLFDSAITMDNKIDLIPSGRCKG